MNTSPERHEPLVGAILPPPPACHMIGVGYRQLMRPSVAIDHLARSAKIWERLKDNPSAAMSYGELGESYEQLGDLVEAERCYLVAIEDFEEDAESYGNKLMVGESLQRVRKKMGKSF